MSKKPTYDQEFVASAVIMLEAAGWPDTPGALSRVARHLGVPKQTLHRWVRKETRADAAPIVTQLKKDVTELLDHIIYGVANEVARRIDGDELDSVTLPQLMTAMGIAVDKKQLLTGKPTSIVEEISKLPRPQQDAIYADAQRLFEEARRRMATDGPASTEPDTQDYATPSTTADRP